MVGIPNGRETLVSRRRILYASVAVVTQRQQASMDVVRNTLSATGM